MKITNLGFPRIGSQRELKFALEQYWRGEISQEALVAVGNTLKARHWQWQAEAGVELIPVGDFAYYDHVLDLTATLNAIPKRHRAVDDLGNIKPIDLDTLFTAARGKGHSAQQVCAAKMTKFFNTNYHYQVAELHEGQTFSIAYEQIFDDVTQAQQLGHTPKPVLLGPVTFLHLSTAVGDFDKLSLLTPLLTVYQQILQRFAEQGVTWVQLDEPVLAAELSPQWQQAITQSYTNLADNKPAELNILLASYYGSIAHHHSLVSQLPVQGLHLDLVSDSSQLDLFSNSLTAEQVLSAGVINGRNVWAADIDLIAQQLKPLADKLADRLWLAPSCSLLHTPVSLDSETQLSASLYEQLAFAKQKLTELQDLKGLLTSNDHSTKQQIINRCQTRRSNKAANADKHVATRLTKLTPDSFQRQSCFEQRISAQHQKLNLPLLPTTTIGSFPQTAAIRGLRKRWRTGDLSSQEYQRQLEQVTKDTIERQLKIGLDVLVHGEAERNDMVEYFAQDLNGVGFTDFGWVQSYGSRCVKPPLIFGDVSREKPMTVEWACYAQSLTEKPVKGMLTGPVTILHWSFAREDIPREQIANQIALAIRDEVADLEQAGISIIQIDEPAFREGLPIKQSQWQHYFDWAVAAFKLSASVVQDNTQIHTHMCYSEFNDSITAIAAMDADVITIETSRSQMTLLDTFEYFQYPNDIGPGVYDIHSPNIPSVDDIVTLMTRAAEKIPVKQLWINPDCGLKTRTWDEVEPALKNVVEAAKVLRRQY
ncbi:5-methyltetrahydropteroyltriglutamate--homocysteine S-methyltransferase [Shewanella gaetbuli]|uniref:5-methyltetrahydropteroyltriglutamate--homocysteine methyltransferase n=1 Tax=Shewanella gaetbuli TaxID=220752 RepID=A0A9X1ZHJ0_9GAMM|nr:5-methyltetrahydropteroyltriglutamate--homocysteine S-methyltransferase [Shewanella gaetbuli]MCL1142424.1 5-methyltetrahydropteroyltriglutamate--homocysteine S-methyltransferase [Shewanella gaetbuli]